MKPSMAYWIETLQLQPHPEGGYFAETYRSGLNIPAGALPKHFKGDRSCSTAIYFLLPGDAYSAFHRIASDEIWHFYAGRPLNIDMIHPDGRHERFGLGPDPKAGEEFQRVVPAGCWFGAALASPANPDDYSLLGCTVAPGFDFADFEMASRAALISDFPQHRELIERLTRIES